MNYGNEGSYQLVLLVPGVIRLAKVETRRGPDNRGPWDAVVALNCELDERVASKCRTRPKDANPVIRNCHMESYRHLNTIENVVNCNGFG